MKEYQKLYRLVTAALFAAAIAVMTAYMLHIPIPTGGYIHIGDALIYLAACLLPLPYAVGAAAVGAGLADLLTAPMWVVPTLIIKAIVVLHQPPDADPLPTEHRGHFHLRPYFTRRLRIGGLCSVGRAQRFFAPVSGHPDSGCGQRRRLCGAGAGVGWG